MKNIVKEELNRNGVDNYLSEIQEYPRLQDEELNELFIRFQNGDYKVKNQIICSNLYLVIPVAKGFLNKGLDLWDLIGAGNEGLINAVNKYNPFLGYPFPLFAKRVIWEDMRDYVMNNSRNIRIPIRTFEEVLKYKKIKEKLLGKKEKVSIDKEIAKKMGISLEKCKLLGEIEEDTISISEIEQEPFISDEYLDELIYTKDNFLDLNEIFRLSNLNDMEKDIIILRYGFKNDEVKSLYELARKYNLNKERIRQIELSAIKKILNTRIIYMAAGNYGISEKTMSEYPYFNSTKNRYNGNSVYDVFNEFTPKQINKAIEKLPVSYVQLLIKQYVNSPLNYNESLFLFNNVYPQIKNFLQEEILVKTKLRKILKTLNSCFK